MQIETSILRVNNGSFTGPLILGTLEKLASVASVSNRVIAPKLERKQKKGSFIPLPLPRH